MDGWVKDGGEMVVLEKEVDAVAVAMVWVVEMMEAWRRVVGRKNGEEANAEEEEVEEDAAKAKDGAVAGMVAAVWGRLSLLHERGWEDRHLGLDQTNIKIGTYHMHAETMTKRAGVMLLHDTNECG